MKEWPKKNSLPKIKKGNKVCFSFGKGGHFQDSCPERVSRNRGYTESPVYYVSKLEHSESNHFTRWEASRHVAMETGLAEENEARQTPELKHCLFITINTDLIKEHEERIQI